MLTKEKVKLYKELHSAVLEEVDKILKVKTQLETGKEYEGTITDLEFYKGKVEVTVEEELRCGCCGSEKEYYSFPESYLYSEDWVDEVKASVEEKKEKERLEKEEKERLKKEQEEQREREEYEKLKRKFENS